MKKKIIIGVSSLLVLIFLVLLFIYKDVIFGSKSAPKPAGQLTDKEKGAVILSEKLGMDKSKFVYESTTENGELVYTNKDNNKKQKTKYIINVETELYSVEQEINMGGDKK